MIYLLIPDVHEEFEKVERILHNYESCVNHTVFFGDYMDSFNYNYNQKGHFIDHLKWLGTAVNKPRRSFLIGNHDVNYFTQCEQYICSGFAPWKIPLVDQYLGRAFWKKLDFLKFYQDNGFNYLFSHGGIHPSKLPPYFEFEEEDFNILNERIKHDFGADIPTTWLNAGRCRGGRQNVGGITWLDFRREFEDIEGLIQIVGHSRDNTVRTIGKSMCIDCGLDYVVILNTADNTHEIIDTGWDAEER